MEAAPLLDLSLGLRGTPGSLGRGVLAAWQRLAQLAVFSSIQCTPSPWSSFPLSFQETPQDTKPPPSSKFRSKEKAREGVGAMV